MCYLKPHLKRHDTKFTVALELAVKVLISAIEPRPTENAPASAIVTALEIIATIKPPSD